MAHLRRWLPLVTLAIAICTLYFYGLDGVGVLLPDEPRYMAIGGEMARTGDLITPRLWGQPWFEKPPLFYWMTAIGRLAGLNPDLSGRLPVASLSLLFLLFFFLQLRRDFGPPAAAISTALLATSAGWLAYSSFGLTDLPLSVCFGEAVLLALSLMKSGEHVSEKLAGIGICLGLGTLAKGLVPIALAIPFAWFLRRFWRQWWIAALCFLIVAAPWYWLVYARNGYPFIEEFFIKHHFERLYSGSLQHLHPWWFYVPVLFGAIVPWSPLLFLLVRKGQIWDERRQFLLASVAFGFLFFSLSRNKLPGYLLPLLPCLFALLGAQFETRRLTDLNRLWLVACASCIAFIPLLARMLPAAIAGDHVSFGGLSDVNRTELFYIVVPIAVALLARRSWAALLLVLCVVSAGIYLKSMTYPVLDSQVSARGTWRKLAPVRASLCDDGLHRNWQYGFAFYRGSPLPPCRHSGLETELYQEGNRPPKVRVVP